MIRSKFPNWLDHQSKLLLRHRYVPLKTNMVALGVMYAINFHESYTVCFVCFCKLECVYLL